MATTQFTPSHSQQRAICHRDGPLLVLAGPGSGKTAVMIRRLAFLVEECHVPPEQILAISFTRASAKELANRFHRLTNNRYPQMTIRTFHSLFYAILRQTYGSLLPTLVTAQQILEPLMKREKNTIWAQVPLRELIRLLSEIKTGTYRAEANPLGGSQELAAFYCAYEGELRRTHSMDLDDLLLHTKELFLTAPAVLARWQQHFSYVLIDEFQDISRLQYEIMKLLAAPEYHFFAVGDDDQAIYRFRGADASFMLEFEKEFAGAGRVLLEQNFRCPDTVVEASSHLISHNKKRYRKRYVSVNKNGAPIAVLKFASAGEEADYLAAQAGAYLQSGKDGSEFAVLVRNHRQLMPLVKALQRARVPYLYREMAQQESKQADTDAQKKCIRLTTMHGAKGLEFDRVYIADVNEGTTPYARGGLLLDAEEERRLFYVAVTRAKKSLTLLVPENEEEGLRPSRFLQEMRLCRKAKDAPANAARP